MPATNPRRYRDKVRGTRSVQESSRLIGCGDHKTHQLMRDGVLEYVQVGNRKLATVASLEKLLGKRIEELERHLFDAAGG